MAEVYKIIAGRITIEKGTGEDLDYSLDLSGWLGNTPGETLLTTTWALSAGLINQNPSTVPAGPATATVSLAGGVLGNNEWATCTFTTATRRGQRTLHLPIVLR